MELVGFSNMSNGRHEKRGVKMTPKFLAQTSGGVGGERINSQPGITGRHLSRGCFAGATQALSKVKTAPRELGPGK